MQNRDRSTNSRATFHLGLRQTPRSGTLAIMWWVPVVALVVSMPGGKPGGAPSARGGQSTRREARAEIRVTLPKKITASVVLTRGVVLARGVALTRGEVLRSATETEPALKIEGDNLTVDFGGLTLRGTKATVEPDQRRGLGVLVRGKNITIRNLRVHGYKVGLMAVSSPGLRIVDSDFSCNWKQRLASTPEREDERDWMSFHKNENREWLRYGAAIYLEDCDRFEVKRNRAVGGQCGLMLSRSDRGVIWNNNFSFLSAIGVGFYRSSENRLMHNQIDWCVRGFSYGVYNRGQDSAGILMFEQCHRNVIAYNSVTHGGDGFFLWAGQTTMDTGEGGCNDNLLYGNDFSHAPTNGIEATFSRNTFANNLLMECWHGVWGGYSYDTKIVGNVFGYNTEAVAIEHGQDNEISGNTFFRDATAVRLWSNEKQDPDWVYPKKRDTRSRGYRISNNLFSHITQGQSGPNPSVKVDAGAALNVRGTEDLVFGPNRFGQLGRVVDLSGPLANVEILPGTVRIPATTVTSADGTTTRTEGSQSWGGMQISKWSKGSSANWGGMLDGLLPPVSSLFAPRASLEQADAAPGRFATNWNPLRNPAGGLLSVGKRPEGSRIHLLTADTTRLAPKPMKGGIDPFLKPGSARGWETILVDEWGPYDFQRPLLRLVDKAAGRYRILGPKGTWRLVGAKGAVVSASSGSVPGWVTILPAKSGKVSVALEYRGERTVDHRGIVTPAGSPARFGFEKFEMPLRWAVKFYRWSKSVNPSDVHAAPEETSLFSGAPIKEWSGDRLEFSGASFLPGLPSDHVAARAETEISGVSGDFELILTADDGARVWLDEYLLISDAWKYQGPTEYRRRVKLNGRHRLRVEHFQIDGYGALKLEIKPLAQRR